MKISHTLPFPNYILFRIIEHSEQEHANTNQNKAGATLLISDRVRQYHQN